MSLPYYTLSSLGILNDPPPIGNVSGTWKHALHWLIVSWPKQWTQISERRRHVTKAAILVFSLISFFFLSFYGGGAVKLGGRIRPPSLPPQQVSGDLTQSFWVHWECFCTIGAPQISWVYLPLQWKTNKYCICWNISGPKEGETTTPCRQRMNVEHRVDCIYYNRLCGYWL